MSLFSLFMSPFSVSASEEASEQAETSTEAIETTSEEESSEATEENSEQNEENGSNLITIPAQPILEVPNDYPEQFTYDDGIDIEYPEEGVKGIYVTGHSASGEKMDELVELLNTTDLNSMVIDVKDDWGNITLEMDSDNPLVEEFTTGYQDIETLMNTMEENDIYPIARIVVFKDSLLSEKYPELSFRNSDGSVWSNSNGESFVNPFQKEVWEYNVEVAKQAAMMGFKEIQFDYVRFPEGFENMADQLDYSLGNYADSTDDVDARVDAVSDFVEYAHKELQPYGVDVSVDIFGYTATIPAAPGIGQDFSRIAENVDVISSMIYPSHWGNGYFDIPVPDLEPYRLVDEYMQVELERLSQLEDPPITRPWLQDFTASYLGAGNYQNYGPAQVEAQIQALSDHGVYEFLLWDASNNYTRGVDYTPHE